MLSFITFILSMLLIILLMIWLISHIKNTDVLLLSCFLAIMIYSFMVLFFGRNFFFPENQAFPLELNKNKTSIIEKYNAEYNSVLEQMDAFSRDTTFKAVTGEKIYQVDSLNNKISELNACIEKCKKHYKADWWNGHFYPKEIADKQPITQKIASELYARFRLEDKK